MNRIVTAAEANRDFSKLLKRVKEGDTVVITNHGTTIATLAPADADDLAARQKALDALVERLQSQPVKNIGKWTRDEANER
ncbi:type II toxin-antitoxin system Phd/YefM family antitoxin [Mesorhizobium australicum]|uniref:Antitoxin n=1 Tax=Mesorhizobium australicum TaxID=536018 RepID=A0A1X7PXL3_9HYPH|nr:type II toxin-antitoxin system prevent-host-death family antitoxin [Mesorhizobium australicum]SMH56855.1 prevent-host-death family protein [Mesorhizobium australicum]